MAERGIRQIVATDFSVRVLRRSRRRLGQLGLGDTVCHLAVDARRMPFRDGSVPCVVSHMGPANIVEGMSEALTELRRVCSGYLLFTHMFCRPEDRVHAPILQKIGHPLAFLDEGLDALQKSGWDVDVVIKGTVPVRPTPSSNLVPDMKIDRFPIANAEFDCVLVRGR